MARTELCGFHRTADRNVAVGQHIVRREIDRVRPRGRPGHGRRIIAACPRNAERLAKSRGTRSTDAGRPKVRQVLLHACRRTYLVIRLVGTLGNIIVRIGLDDDLHIALKEERNVHDPILCVFGTDGEPAGTVKTAQIGHRSVVDQIDTVGPDRLKGCRCTEILDRPRDRHCTVHHHRRYRNVGNPQVGSKTGYLDLLWLADIVRLSIAAGVILKDLAVRVCDGKQIVCTVEAIWQRDRHIYAILAAGSQAVADQRTDRCVGDRIKIRIGRQIDRIVPASVRVKRSLIPYGELNIDLPAREFAGRCGYRVQHRQVGRRAEDVHR